MLQPIQRTSWAPVSPKNSRGHGGGMSDGYSEVCAKRCDGIEVRPGGHSVQHSGLFGCEECLNATDELGCRFCGSVAGKLLQCAQIARDLPLTAFRGWEFHTVPVHHAVT